MASVMPDIGALERRLAGLPVVKHPARELVLTAGSESGKLLFLRSGAVEVVKEGVRIANVSAPGSVFGEQSALLSQPHSADVRTVEQSEFYVADASAIWWGSYYRALCRGHPCTTTRRREPNSHRTQAPTPGRRASERDWQDRREGRGAAKLYWRCKPRICRLSLRSVSVRPDTLRIVWLTHDAPRSLTCIP
jgi:Cyclic nucleotide-binding domain